MSFHLRGHRSKTRANYRIAQRLKFEDTKPELAFDELAESHGFLVTRPAPVTVTDSLGTWTLRPDRQIGDVYVEIDGKYHRTPRQERKTAWRDMAIFYETGKRVLHIDAELLTDKRWWEHVVTQMDAFLLAGKTEPWSRIFA